MKNITRFKTAYLVLLALLMTCLAGAGAENMIGNPDFDGDSGFGGIPFWDSDVWDSTAAFSFDTEKLGVYNCLHIRTYDDNDARWIQTVAVEPDTEYRLSGYILAQGCSQEDGARGANLSIYNSSAYTESVYDTAGEWQYVEIYGKTGSDQTELTVCARIGGFSGIGTGEAWFRDIELEQDEAPAGAAMMSFATYAPSGAARGSASLAAGDTSGDALSERKTLYWILTDIVFIIVFIQAYVIVRQIRQKRGQKGPWSRIPAIPAEIFSLALILALACWIRVYFACHVRGYKNDIECFLYWGSLFREQGFRFYANASFHDYPPLYMMLLGGMDALREELHIAYASQTHVFLIKLIPMFSDLITAGFLYGICRKKLGAIPCVLLAALIALNPAYIADSAAWGQVDSLLALLLVLTVFFGMKGRWYVALPVYALAVLTKPQALLFGPIGLIAVVVDGYRAPRQILNALIGLAGAIAVLIAVSLPFAYYELPWTQESSVAKPLKEAQKADPINFNEQRENYLAWYNETFVLKNRDQHVFAEEIAGKASRDAFTELEKTSAFTAEYYLLQREVSYANAESSFDSAETQLRERYASETILFEFYSAARLKQWQAIASEYRAVIDNDGELDDSEWLFVEMYDNVLSLPGLSDVLESDAVPSRSLYLITWLWDKLMGTAQSYRYLTVNACNFYVILGKNWTRLDNEMSPERMRYFAWFMFGAAYVFAAAVLIGKESRKKADQPVPVSGCRYLPLAGAVLISILFSFAPMMHERYLFPAIALSLLAFYRLRDRRLLWYCLLASSAQFLNIALVLEWGGVIGMGNLQDSEKAINTVVSVVNVASTLFLCWTAFDISLGWRMKKPVASGDYRLHLRRFEFAAMAVVTALYAVVAFINLGETDSPVTGYTTQRKNEQIVFDLGEVKTYRLTYYGGISSNYFTVALSNDGEAWTEENAASYGEGDIYKWIWYVPKTYSGSSFSNASYSRERAADTGEGGVKVTYASADSTYPLQTSRYVRFTVADEKYYTPVATQRMVLNEVAFLDAETGKPLPVASVSGSQPGADYTALIDEQDKVAAYPSYYNGMFFDEIYHARTGYELLNGYESNHILEWSHPHLGKLLIALGIKLFGMTPFGWRFSGTLIGALMLPVIYLLIRQLSGKSSSALFGMLLMALDSMHFTQTRLATVDSYAVFFIMLMYLFMIRYFRMNLFSVPFLKQLFTLLLSGIFMGLACASKWIGAYAAVGLGLIFFIKTFMTLREYLKLKHADREHSAQFSGYPVRQMLTIDLCCISFVAIPVLIYYFSYYWHFAASGGLSVEKVWQLQQQMYSYHANIVDTHYFKTPWYEWPIIVWPMWYFSADTAYIGKGNVSSISLMGNPAVWWVGILCLTAVSGIYAMQKKKDHRLLLVIISFASQYLPWVLVPRSTYIYHYFASVPFIIAATALAAEYLEAKYRTAAKAFRIGLVVAALILFVLFYPLESGATVSYSYAKILRWFDWYNFALQ